MRSALFTVFIFLGIVLVAHAQKNITNIQNEPLVQVLSQIEEKYQVSFSYKDDNVAGYEVSIPAGSYSMQAILEKVFVQTRLTFEILDGQHILIAQKSTQDSDSYLCGYIKDELSGEPYMYASIHTYSLSTFTESDTLGYFKVAVGVEDKFVYISYLGCESYRISITDNLGQPCLDYYLSSKAIDFETVVLTEYLLDGISQSENANTIVIEPGEMSLLPGSVDQDVMAAIQFLPGITSATESLDDLSIRGGTPDQNLILYDGIPMYHTSHFFGSISAFNPFIIDNISVHRSGIGSEYGGRVSGVIDIKSEEEIAKKFSIGAGINLMHTYVDTKFPLWKNSSIVFSTRRSITELWNTPTFVSYAERVFQGTKIEDNNFNDPNLAFSDEFKFNDANLKWMWNVGENKFSISLLGALNNLKYRTELPEFKAFAVDALNLRNSGSAIKWERQWSDKYRTKVELTNAEYDYDYDLSFREIGKETEVAPISVKSGNRVLDGGFNWTNYYKINDGQKVNFGYQFTDNRINLSFKTVNRGNVKGTSEILQNRLHSLFGDYSLDLPDVLHLDIGLRYQYSADIKNNYFEPRIALVTDVTSDFKLKISTSKHFQFVSQLVSFDVNQLGLNNQIWVASNNTTIPVIESNQWMGGFIYKKNNWTIDLEGYVKEIDGITTLTNNFVELPDQAFSIGKSRIRGIDVLLKRRVGRFRSWMSYTLSQSLYEFITIGPEAVPATHDQKHILQWVNIYKTGPWELSFGLSWRSGLPTTLADGVVLQPNNSGELVPVIDYQDVNGARLPIYQRVDASVVYNFGDKETLSGFIGFSLQNMRNRTNILGKQYLLGDIDASGLPEFLETEKKGLKFTPNLSVNVRFK